MVQIRKYIHMCVYECVVCMCVCVTERKEESENDNTYQQKVNNI